MPQPRIWVTDGKEQPLVMWICDKKEKMRTHRMGDLRGQLVIPLSTYLRHDVLFFPSVVLIPVCEA